jgi:hypothetical protein
MKIIYAKIFTMGRGPAATVIFHYRHSIHFAIAVIDIRHFSIYFSRHALTFSPHCREVSRADAPERYGAPRRCDDADARAMRQQRYAACRYRATLRCCALCHRAPFDASACRRDFSVTPPPYHASIFMPRFLIAGRLIAAFAAATPRDAAFIFRRQATPLRHASFRRLFQIFACRYFFFCRHYFFDAFQIFSMAFDCFFRRHFLIFTPFFATLFLFASATLILRAISASSFAFAFSGISAAESPLSEILFSLTFSRCFFFLSMPLFR